MDQDKQTLLEAAKAMSRACDGTSRWDVEVNRFRAAIAREEAHPSPTTEANDRAQQAEADAKWHREESARLSESLARMTDERDYLQQQVANTDSRIAAMEIHGNSADHWYRKATAYKDAFRVRDEAVKRAENAEAESARLSAELAKERERAEKAEAERDLAKNQLALAVERSERQSALIQSATQASGCHMPADVPDSIRSLRARAQQAEADVRWHRDQYAWMQGRITDEIQRAEKAEANEKQLRQEYADLAKQVAAERAEACRSVKAEAELAKVHEALKACLRPETQTGTAIGDAKRIGQALQHACAHLFRALPGVNVVERDLPLVVDELLRLRAEMAELRRINTALEEQRNQFADAAGLGRKFSTERDLMKRVDELSEQLKSAQKQCGVERTEVERLRADIDMIRDHLQAVVGASDVARKAMMLVSCLVWGAGEPSLKNWGGMIFYPSKDA